MLANPKEFGQREIRERRIAGELNQAIEADVALEFLRLSFCALIAPNEGGAYDFVAFIEQHRAVHLTREADGGDGLGRETGRPESLGNSEGGGAPPVARVLLGPAGLWTGEIGVLFRARCKDDTALINNDRASAASTDINTEEWDDAS